MTEWQPIETAPKDGTRVLLLRGKFFVCGKWDEDRYNQKPRPYWSHDAERWLGKKDARDNPPTHWACITIPSASPNAGAE